MEMTEQEVDAVGPARSGPVGSDLNQRGGDLESCCSVMILLMVNTGNVPLLELLLEEDEPPSGETAASSFFLVGKL